MAVLSDYLSGTITVTKGSTAFTGTGTAWRVAGFREGDTVQLQGFTAVIAGTSAVDPLIKSNNTGNFTEPWDGSSGTFAYRMRYLPDGARVTAQTRVLIELLGNGVLYSIAGLPVVEGGILVGGASGQYVSKPIADITNAIDSKFDKAGGTVAGNLDMQGTIRLRSSNQTDNAPFQYIKDYNYIDRWGFLMYPNNDFLYCVWSGSGYVRDVVRFRQDGSVNFFGSLSKGSGTFLIDHPLDPLNKNLRHGFVEAPEYLNIYRGTVRLVNGRATVNIDDYFDMMQGTFWALNTDVIVSSLQNQDGFSRVRPDGKMTDGTLNIICEDEACNDEIAWMVTGRRKDAYVLHLDPNCERGTGRFIPEIEKED